jgi:hypothetical protein
MVDGKPRFRVVGFDLKEARRQRAVLMQAAKRGEVPVATSLRPGSVVDRRLVRYKALVLLRGLLEGFVVVARIPGRHSVWPGGEHARR